MPVDAHHGTPQLDARPVTAERWADLERLFGPRGVYGGCWCTWWRLTRSQFSQYSAAARKQVLQGIVAAGQVPGIVLYLDEPPVAWCSIGPREWYPALKRCGSWRAWMTSRSGRSSASSWREHTGDEDCSCP